MTEAVRHLIDGGLAAEAKAEFLAALAAKGETVEEIAGFAMDLRALSIVPPLGEALRGVEILDVCGTGGDRLNTFNISTTVAIVASAAGLAVAKHGNRAITSRSGSADVLDALGIRVDHDAASAGAALATNGFAFMFAPGFHPAMRHAGPTRKEIGVRTAFNLIGPLTNPASVRRLVVGVADPAAAPRVAAVLHRLGTERAFVVHGAGIDELPLDGTGIIHEVDPSGVREVPVNPVALGLASVATAELAGGTPDENARFVEGVLAGKTGPRRDVVLLNAAAGLTVAGRTASLADGVALARRTIDDGATMRLLGDLRAERAAHEQATADASQGAPA